MPPIFQTPCPEDSWVMVSHDANVSISIEPTCYEMISHCDYNAKAFTSDPQLQQPNKADDECQVCRGRCEWNNFKGITRPRCEIYKTPNIGYGVRALEVELPKYALHSDTKLTDCP